MKPRVVLQGPDPTLRLLLRLASVLLNPPWTRCPFISITTCGSSQLFFMLTTFWTWLTTGFSEGGAYTYMTENSTLACQTSLDETLQNCERLRFSLDASWIQQTLQISSLHFKISFKLPFLNKFQVNLSYLIFKIRFRFAFQNKFHVSLLFRENVLFCLSKQVSILF